MKPTYQLLPPLDEQTLANLKADIKAHGVQVPIVVDEEGAIIDGHHRKAICDELGIDCPVDPKEALTTEQKRALAISLNAHRRHLTGEQKREALAELIKAEPEKSNRQIAEAVGVDHKTAGSVRNELEGRGEIPHVENRTDSQGRSQPATKTTNRKSEGVTVEKSGGQSDDEPIPHDPETGEVLDEPQASSNVVTDYSKGDKAKQFNWRDAWLGAITKSRKALAAFDVDDIAQAGGEEAVDELDQLARDLATTAEEARQKLPEKVRHLHVAGGKK